MSRARLGAFLLRHKRIERPLHRLLHRPHDRKTGCFICRLVWAYQLAIPGVREALDKGRADIDAGRWYRLDTRTWVSTPNPDWPDDGTRPDDWPESHERLGTGLS